jgi:hypothetical protein
MRSVSHVPQQSASGAAIRQQVRTILENDDAGLEATVTLLSQSRKPIQKLAENRIVYGSQICEFSRSHCEYVIYCGDGRVRAFYWTVILCGAD